MIVVQGTMHNLQSNNPYVSFNKATLGVWYKRGVTGIGAEREEKQCRLITASSNQLVTSSK